MLWNTNFGLYRTELNWNLPLFTEDSGTSIMGTWYHVRAKRRDLKNVIAWFVWIHVCRNLDISVVLLNKQASLTHSRNQQNNNYEQLRSRERERNVLVNDALNTFYLRLYGVRHMVKDHSDSEKGNPLPPHRLLLSINSKGSFICTIPQTG